MNLKVRWVKPFQRGNFPLFSAENKKNPRKGKSMQKVGKKFSKKLIKEKTHNDWFLNARIVHTPEELFNVKRGKSYVLLSTYGSLDIGQNLKFGSIFLASI